MTGPLPQRVRIVEVGPRDGLQNQPEVIPVARKLEWIQRLARAGLEEIEVTSFVHPRWVPQLADADDLLRALAPDDVRLPSALVPNPKGLSRAIDAGMHRIALFAAASESFSQKNINCSIDESFDRFRDVFRSLEEQGITAWVRGYVSTCFGCPYEGDVSEDRVAEVSERFLELGVAEVAISDTIGVAYPPDVERVIGRVTKSIPIDRVALHFHDTRGQALVNVFQGLQLGVATYDSSAGGLGGCPYAPGAAGNLATEDLVLFLHRLGIATGVDFDELVDADLWFESHFQTLFPSRVLATQRSPGGSES